jgi:hypothetical protein
MREAEFLTIVLAIEFPLHSQEVFNPSIFTIEKFKEGEKDKKSLNKGLFFALILNLLFVFAVYKFYKTAGIVAFVVSLLIFAYYYQLINK